MTWGFLWDFAMGLALVTLVNSMILAVIAWKPWRR